MHVIILKLFEYSEIRTSMVQVLPNVFANISHSSKKGVYLLYSTTIQYERAVLYVSLYVRYFFVQISFRPLTNSIFYEDESKPVTLTNANV